MQFKKWLKITERFSIVPGMEPVQDPNVLNNGALPRYNPDDKLPGNKKAMKKMKKKN